MLELIQIDQLQLLNELCQTTFFLPNATQNSALDFTPCASSLESLVVNWYIDDEPTTGSDHPVLKFGVKSLQESHTKVPATATLHGKKADWNKSQNHLERASEKIEDN